MKMDNSLPLSINFKEKQEDQNMSALFKTSHLQELLILQLDLIQEQQRQLTMKDKHIIALKTERDQLEARVNRMERRIATQKRHTIDTDGSSKLLSPASRGSHFNLQPLSKKEPLKLAERKSKPICYGAPITISSRQDKTFRFSSHINTNSLFLDDPKLMLGLKKKSIAKEESVDEKVTVPAFSLVKDKPADISRNEDTIEDISDDGYLKRHSKPEQEEKRRKRWDLQVLRQQRQKEILVQKSQNKKGKQQGKQGKQGKQQGKQGKSSSGTKAMKDDTDQKPNTQQALVDSFFRNAEGAMAIEICDMVPVCVFGNPLPAVKQKDFDVPWFSIAKREIQIREAKQKLMKKQGLKYTRRRSRMTKY